MLSRFVCKFIKNEVYVPFTVHISRFSFVFVCVAWNDGPLVPCPIYNSFNLKTQAHINKMDMHHHHQQKQQQQIPAKIRGRRRGETNKQTSKKQRKEEEKRGGKFALLFFALTHSLTHDKYNLRKSLAPKLALHLGHLRWRVS